MDNALEKLRQIGIEKIQEDTNLDLTKIDCILNKRFEKLDSVRARGFINILQRQYGLDLSSWLQEYKEFHQMLLQEKKDEDCVVVHSKKNSYLVWGALGVLGIVGAILLFSFIPKASADLETTKKTMQEPQITQELIIEEIPQVQPLEEKQTQEEGQVKEEEQKQEKKPQIEQKNISEYGVEIFPNIAFNEENILYIESAKPLWVGMINLENRKRIAKTKQEFDIPLDKQLLISIARGGFVLSLDEESREFKGYLPVYLIYTKEGGLREISQDEFVYLNGGVQW
ncbi:hypothetical protein [Helicobacter cholecystus]|uniref:hypothetical protein n=1 Tax=Helicobacter cholecystus TaxID=45498 RepID=UPI0027389877|nr:hypothetical protein [Helicobacter cholecystus]